MSLLCLLQVFTGQGVTLSDYMLLPVEQYFVLDPDTVVFLGGDRFTLFVPRINVSAALRRWGVWERHDNTWLGKRGGNGFITVELCRIVQPCAHVTIVHIMLIPFVRGCLSPICLKLSLCQSARFRF